MIARVSRQVPYDESKFIASLKETLMRFRSIDAMFFVLTYAFATMVYALFHTRGNSEPNHLLLRTNFRMISEIWNPAETTFLSIPNDRAHNIRVDSS